MTRIISFMHISLDGFVAGPNREMNWIKVDEELFAHIGKRISQTGAALYGRVTYDMMEGYWPQLRINQTRQRMTRNMHNGIARRIKLSCPEP
jgi:dihydrofolate reductase